MNPGLATALRQLRLSGLLASLEVRLQEAGASRLGHAEFLELLLQDELNVRKNRQLERRKQAAGFRALQPLDQFDWSFNPSIERKVLFELATCRFVREHTDVLFLGPPGVGKSFLAQALGYCAIQQGFEVLYRSIFDLIRDFLQAEAFTQQDKALRKYLKPDLLIIDDMGLKALPKHSGEYLFEVIMRRYENRSTIMTSNRPLEDWGHLLADVPTAGAILDRFLHHARLIAITGRSYRIKDSPSLRNQGRKPGPKAGPDSSPPPESPANLPHPGDPRPNTPTPGAHRFVRAQRVRYAWRPTGTRAGGSKARPRRSPARPNARRDSFGPDP